MGLKTYFQELFTVYTRPHTERIKSPSIATLFCVVILLVWISFFASIRLDISKIFKSTCQVRGGALSKVKGIASTEHLTDLELAVENGNLYRKIWDSIDLVYPVQGGEGATGSFTIVTNQIITPNQTRNTNCGEKLNNGAKCTSDLDCEKGVNSVNGIYTGICIGVAGVCEIRGWCPVESDKLPRNGDKPLLEDVANFTVLIKNIVDFPRCGVDYNGNNLFNKSKEYVDNCIHHPVKDPHCPKFTIRDIVEWSGHNFSDVAITGGVFRIRIKWQCDFDFGRTTKDCSIKYKFSRVGDMNVGVVRGWNFRSADFHSSDFRTLKKQYGLKILIDLEGEGMQTDFFLFITTLGSTIGLFSVAPWLCDFLLDILQYFRGKEKCEKNDPHSSICQVHSNTTTHVPTSASSDTSQL